MSTQEQAILESERYFGHPPSFVVSAPGRVNLIGEHTDYNDGFVLPIAIDRAVWIALRPTATQQVILHSLDLKRSAEFSLENIKYKNQEWVEYIKGIAWALQQAGYLLEGWQGLIASDIPVGAGLSSSAALELTAARAFAAVSSYPWEAIVHFKNAMRLSPFYPAWYLSRLGVCYHLTGQYDKAIETLKKGIERRPNQYFIRVRLAAVYSDLGRDQDARAEAAEVLRIKPDFSIEAYAKANPFRDTAIVAHRKELLRKAGLK